MPDHREQDVELGPRKPPYSLLSYTDSLERSASMIRLSICVTAEEIIEPVDKQFSVRRARRAPALTDRHARHSR
jgi:hypothetical protein